MKDYLKWQLKAIIADKKDHVLEAKHVINTTGYNVFNDGNLMFYGAIITPSELKEKIEFLKQFYIIVEENIPELNEEGEVVEKRHRRTKLEMQAFKRQRETEKQYEHQAKQPRKDPIRIPKASPSQDNTVPIKRRGRPRKTQAPTTPKRIKPSHRIRKEMDANTRTQIKKKRGRPLGSKNRKRVHSQGRKLT